MAISIDTTWTGVADNASGNNFVQTGAHSSGASPTLLVVGFKITTLAQPFINFTDSQGSTYQTLGPFGAGSTLVYIGYTVPLPSTTYQIKANFTGTTGKSMIGAASFNGISTVSPFDRSAFATGSGTSLDSGSSATTSFPQELLIGMGSLDGGSVITWTATNGFTKASEVAVTVDGCLEYQIVAAQGTYNATLTTTVSQTWQIALATFIGAGQQIFSENSEIIQPMSTGPGVTF